jgi:hypothetical protein
MIVFKPKHVAFVVKTKSFVLQIRKNSWTACLWSIMPYMFLFLMYAQVFKVFLYLMCFDQSLTHTIYTLQHYPDSARSEHNLHRVQSSDISCDIRYGRSVCLDHFISASIRISPRNPKFTIAPYWQSTFPYVCYDADPQLPVTSYVF